MAPTGKCYSLHVMSIEGQERVCRIGYHSTSDKDREQKVSQASGETWKIQRPAGDGAILVGNRRTAESIKDCVAETLKAQECPQTTRESAKGSRQYVHYCDWTKAYKALKECFDKINRPN